MSAPLSVSIASATDLCVKYGHHVILDNAKISITEGERIGLVGKNGAGKSTALKIIAGVEEPDSGTVSIRRDAIVGYLPQNFELDEEKTVLENVLAGAEQVQALIDAYEEDPNAENAPELLDRITALDGWTLDSRAQALINNLHAPEASRIVKNLSGGEKRRVALCRTLVAQPDFLILDEPTNHLDTEAIEWQEKFLASYKGTCLFVTHDRYFLDNIATSIIELTGANFISYQGNYTDYLLTRAERMENEARAEHKRQRFLTKELDWVRRRPKARGSKAKDRIDRFFEVKEQDAPEVEMEVELVIPPASQLSNKVIDVEGVSMSYPDPGAPNGTKTLFENLDFKLEPKERIGIVGRNGLGKSTLIKVILGMIEPSAGSVSIGQKTEINYVDQNRLQLDEEKSIFEEVGQGTESVRIGDDTIGLRTYLKRFLFDDDRINTKISLLSGGERSRVLLAKILKRGGNVLVLDEPTNDLDLSTLRVLEEALVHFKGCALIVSHDRYFLNRVCTSILAFEGAGKLTYQVGNYDYYLEKKAEREKAQQPTAKTEPKATKSPRRAEQPPKLKWAEEKELETIEDDILIAEEAATAKEEEMAHPDFYKNHPHDWQEHETELKQLQTAVTDLYEKWERYTQIKTTWEEWKNNK